MSWTQRAAFVFMSGSLTDEFDLTPVIDVHGKDINVTLFYLMTCHLSLSAWGFLVSKHISNHNCKSLFNKSFTPERKKGLKSKSPGTMTMNLKCLNLEWNTQYEAILLGSSVCPDLPTTIAKTSGQHCGPAVRFQEAIWSSAIDNVWGETQLCWHLVEHFICTTSRAWEAIEQHEKKSL